MDLISQQDSVQMSHALSSEVTIAVLPFENLTGEGRFDIFCKSFCVDLITELSRFKQFQIIAYDSIRELDHPFNSTSEKFQRLHAVYMVKGSCRSHDSQLRINTQLIKSETNHVVWADRFDGETESLFAIQEDILRGLVASLQQQLNFDLLTQIKKKNPIHLKAYEYWLYGIEEVKKGTLASDLQARVYFQNAIELDPNYSLAYSGMSLTYFNEWSCQLWDRWEISQKGAFDWAKKAIELDEYNHVACVVLGRLYLFMGEYDTAEHYLRKALRLNPNDTDFLIEIATCFIFLGYVNEAERLYKRALKLNPLHNEAYHAIGAFIYFELGDVEKAITLGEMSGTNHWVDAPAHFAAAYHSIGDYDHMHQFWNLFIRQYEEKINGGESATSDEALDWVIAVNPFKGQTRFQTFWDYIRSGQETQRSTQTVVLPLHRPHGIFQKDQEFWRLAFNGESVQMPEVKGFNDIRQLLQQPGDQIHCAELMGAILKSESEIVFDDKAKKEYHNKIRSLQKEIQIAESHHDISRAESLQKEYDQIIDHLSSSLGLQGRPRQIGSPVEKARSAVTWRIRHAIKRIDTVHSALGRHLSASIKTGTFCIYQPENPVDWVV